SGEWEWGKGCVGEGPGMSGVVMGALVVALPLAVLSSPAPAQVPSGPLTIHVEAVLEPIRVKVVRTVFSVNGTAGLAGLIEGQSEVSGFYDLIDRSDVAPLPLGEP